MDRTFYKLDVQGIVYLVEAATSKAYTYDLSNPTEVGKIIWTDSKAGPSIELLADWSSILAAKLDAQPTQTATTTSDATATHT
jgi:hypothetical protein